jgi:hypothetical protein
MGHRCRYTISRESLVKEAALLLVGRANTGLGSWASLNHLPLALHKDRGFV